MAFQGILANVAHMSLRFFQSIGRHGTEIAPSIHACVCEKNSLVFRRRRMEASGRKGSTLIVREIRVKRPFFEAR